MLCLKNVKIFFSQYESRILIDRRSSYFMSGG